MMMMMSFKDCALLILFAALYFYEIRRPLEDADGEKFYEKMRLKYFQKVSKNRKHIQRTCDIMVL